MALTLVPVGWLIPRPITTIHISSRVPPPTMAHVVQSLDQPSNYKDSRARYDRQKQNELLAKSTTLYVCSRPHHNQARADKGFRLVTLAFTLQKNRYTNFFQNAQAQKKAVVSNVSLWALTATPGQRSIIALPSCPSQVICS